MSDAVSDTLSPKDQLAVIDELEALLALCRIKRPSKAETVFQCWMGAAMVLATLGFVGMALLKPYALFPLMLGMLAGGVGMCNYPVDPTMTKEECAQVFSRFNHLPDREDLLERYARYGALSYREVAMQLNKALYELRMTARKAEIMELAKGVKDIPSKAV